ncbi:MAG: CsgG/HfaB family protein [Elusimicrobiota bacterium]|nr:CsgG/HfaB family protein [Elusimicrobiota bacterium]
MVAEENKGEEKMSSPIKNNLLLLFLTVLLVSCGGQKIVAKHDAFDKGKIEVTTEGKPEPHKSGIIIAILPFRNNSSDKNLDVAGSTLADLISAQMASKKGFKLVERQRIEEILSEMKLGPTGMIDPNTAIQVGKILGANVMAFGSFSTLGKKVLLTMRLVKVETGEIVGGVTERSDDISNLDILAENASIKLSNSLQIK